MKTTALLLLLSLTLFRAMAFDAPQMDTTMEEDKAPRGSVLLYNGVEYVKRYKYIMHLNGYAATIQRAADAARVDSIYKVITREANNRLVIDGDKYVSAAGYVKNITAVKNTARKVLGREWIEELALSEKNVRVNIVANAQEEVIYLDISYISDDPTIDKKMIILQEQLLEKVKFGVDGAKFETLGDDSDKKSPRKKRAGYEFYYMFWVTNLYIDSSMNPLYLSRGSSMVN